MTLSIVTAGNTVLAADLNQTINVLQRPSGGVETGSYFLTFAGYTTGAVGGAWINSESRGATPVSVTIDTSLNSPGNCGSPSTNTLTANGFHVYAFSTTTNTSCNVGGLYTLSY